MKKEYDFSKAQKGKFFVPENEIEIPIYLEKKVRAYYAKIAKNKHVGIGKIVNLILKKEMDIQKEISEGK